MSQVDTSSTAGAPNRSTALCLTLAASLALFSSTAQAQSSPSAVQPPPAQAEPSDQEKVVAQTLFDEGRALVAAGNYDAACKKFAESLRVDPGTGTKFHLAECLAKTTQIATAWNYYKEVAAESARSNKTDRETFARARAEALRPRLPTITVIVSSQVREVEGLSITRDGSVVGEPQFGTPIPVNLGPHTIHVTAPHMKPWDSAIDVKEEGQKLEVTVPPLEPEADGSQPIPPPRSSAGLRMSGYTAGGIGIVGLGIGAVLGGVAVAKKNASNEAGDCQAGNVCDATGIQLRNEGIDAATGSTIAFIAGGLALTSGIVMLLVSPSDKVRSPRVAIGPRGVFVEGTW